MPAQDETLRYEPGPTDRRARELPERPLEILVSRDGPARRAILAGRAAVRPRTTRGQFAAQLLKRIGNPPMSQPRLLVLMSWMQAEGDAARWNPLNTTLHLPGSTRFNFADVQNYVGFLQGVSATAQTLNFGAKHDQHGYKAIRHGLYVGAKPSIVLRAIENSAWGTGGLALRVYEQTKDAILLDLRHHRLVGA